MSNIFEKREEIRPYEYPQLMKFVDAIDDSFWTVRKFDFSKDIEEFNTELNDVEREFIKRSMLAISQIENTVKSFFGRLDLRLPKAEISFVGAKLAANEVTHSISYARLLDLLGLDDEFKHLVEVSAMKDRLEYLRKYLGGLTSRSNKEFTKSVILFTLTVENISLYAPFLNMASTKRYKQKLKTVGKVISATAREELIHSKFGAALINIIKEENPDWFDADMEAKIRRNIRKAVDAEDKVLDWIFELGEPDYLSKAEVKEYLKSRANDSLNLIGYSSEYELDSKLLEKSDFMDVMLLATPDFDFFDERSTDYDKNRAFDVNDVFG